jgi:hypothetical protein
VYISIIIVVLLLSIIAMMSVSNTYASTNDTDDVNKPLYRQIQDLRLNPHFSPDESCMFDAYQLHSAEELNWKCSPKYGYDVNQVKLVPFSIILSSTCSALYCQYS